MKVFHGAESTSFFTNKILMMPHNFKRLNNVEAFKQNIKKWQSESYPCGLRAVFLSNLGFL